MSIAPCSHNHWDCTHPTNSPSNCRCCQVIVRFPRLPDPLRFRAEIGAARRFADEVNRSGRNITVLIDLDAPDDLPPLPCERLWESA